MGGKRIRPLLVLLGCNVFTDKIEQAIYPSIALEVFHNFTLLHDDIMDNSEKRRNRPTVHMKWNQNVAILSGDAMLIKSYELLSRGPADCLQQLLGLFSKSAIEVCEGQQYDMDFENEREVTPEQYIRMIELKTAIIIATALKMGSILAGAPKKDADLMYEFGKNLGIAFQLQDDLLDVYANPSLFGKVTGNDIISNKKTFLLIQAIILASGNVKKELKRWLSLKKFNSKEKIFAIKKIYDKLQIKDLTMKCINSYHQQGLGLLENVNIDDSRKTELIAFTQTLLHRQK
jgi:geranylgeranyl diphosphate synthase type II